MLCSPSFLLIILFQDILPEKSRPALNLSSHHSCPPSHRRGNYVRWTSVGLLGISNGALLWYSATWNSVAATSMGFFGPLCSRNSAADTDKGTLWRHKGAFA